LQISILYSETITVSKPFVIQARTMVDIHCIT